MLTQYSLEKLCGRIRDLDDHEKLVLDSIRHQDQDQSIKDGATLAFSGLLIATAIVLFASGQDSLTRITLFSIQYYMAVLGILLLFLSAVAAMWSLISSRGYSDDARTALEEYHALIRLRQGRGACAIVLGIMGAASVIFAFFMEIIL